MRFGEGLREEREGRGISLDEVSVGTRVSMRHLHALESDRFTELPGGVFNRGIVRSYAQFCGLDVDSTVRNFNAAIQAAGLAVDPKTDDLAEFAEAVRRSRSGGRGSRRWRWVGLLAMVLGVCLVAAGVFWVLLHRGIVHMPARKRLLAIRSTG